METYNAVVDFVAFGEGVDNGLFAVKDDKPKISGLLDARPVILIIENKKCLHGKTSTNQNYRFIRIN